jgi:hypothetical protein
MKPSSTETLRLLVQPDDCHGTAQVSGRVAQRGSQISRRIRRPQPAPADQVRARRHGGRPVSLQQCQVTDHADQLGRPVTTQQLGSHRDPLRVSARELVDAHP